MVEMQITITKPPTQWTDALSKPKQCIHRYSRSLVGLTHPNKQGNERIPLVRKLGIGSKLLLVPDPDNPVDRNAILIYRADDTENDLGYLDAGGAKLLCPLMERGATFEAEVYWINNDSPSLPGIHIFIYQMTEPVRARRPVRRRATSYRRPTVRPTDAAVVSVNPLIRWIKSLFTS